MAKGFFGTTGAANKGHTSKNLLSGALIERAPKMPGTVQSMDALTPDPAGVQFDQPSVEFGPGKVLAPKGNSGVVRPTTKPKKG